MYNLQQDTGCEAGILVYADGDVGVYNWAAACCGDNEYPILSPFGSPLAWPDAKGEILRLVEEVEDVRPYLPETAYNPVYDANGDLPVLLGGEPPFSGAIWELTDEDGERVITVITLDSWN